MSCQIYFKRTSVAQNYRLQLIHTYLTSGRERNWSAEEMKEAEISMQQTNSALLFLSFYGRFNFVYSLLESVFFILECNSSTVLCIK